MDKSESASKMWKSIAVFLGICCVYLTSNGKAVANSNAIQGFVSSAFECFGDSDVSAMQSIEQLLETYEAALSCEKPARRLLDEEYYFLFLETFISAKSNNQKQCKRVQQNFFPMREFIRSNTSQLDASCGSDWYVHPNAGSICTVTAFSGLNIREIPEILDKATKINAIPQGYEVKFIDQINEWTRIIVTPPSSKAKIVGWVTTEQLACPF